MKGKNSGLDWNVVNKCEHTFHVPSVEEDPEVLTICYQDVKHESGVTTRDFTPIVKFVCPKCNVTRHYELVGAAAETFISTDGALITPYLMKRVFTNEARDSFIRIGTEMIFEFKWHPSFKFVGSFDDASGKPS